MNIPQELFDIYTNKEEYSAPFRDLNDKDRYYNSSNRKVTTPVVSEYLYSQGFRPVYPDNKTFAVCLTHDIDALYASNSYKNLIKQVYAKRASVQSLVNLLLKRRIYIKEYSIEQMLAIEEKYNANASYYFIAVEKNEIDFNYSVEEILPLLKLIQSKGSEVGLHGGFEKTYLSSPKIGREKNRLEKVLGKEVTGYRNQWLKFRTPDTITFLEENNFKYDTTLGYCDMVGFRNGMCYPHQPYNLHTGKFSNLLEIPLVIMDVTLWRYMDLDFETAFNVSKSIIDQTIKMNGVFTLLWHNNYMTGEQIKLYERILSYCVAQNAWISSGEKITEWWKEKKYDVELLDYLNR